LAVAIQSTYLVLKGQAAYAFAMPKVLGILAGAGFLLVAQLLTFPRTATHQVMMAVGRRKGGLNSLLNSLLFPVHNGCTLGVATVVRGASQYARAAVREHGSCYKAAAAATL
jgi:hypothetical protein